MSEELLHFIWKYRLYNSLNLKTSEGESVEVINPGLYNQHAGPDFFNAKIKIDNTLWVGNVEIHLKSSDWDLHGHASDHAYNNVILHVVAQRDADVINASGNKVPGLEIPFENVLLARYQNLMQKQRWIECGDALPILRPPEWSGWMENLMVEKLMEKDESVHRLLNEFNNHWDQVFFCMTARSFGAGVNGEPFEIMARQTPVNVLLLHSNNLLQVEALLFGQAGMLKSAPADAYHAKLTEEYRFLADKYGLKAIEPHLWKFLRLRPANFPTIRIAQLARFINQTSGLFEPLLRLNSPAEVQERFQLIASSYWDNHYRFGHLSADVHHKQMGKLVSASVVLNAIIPFAFVYGKQRGDESLTSKCMEWLELMPSEANSVLKNWKTHASISAVNALESQALIYLYSHYCVHRKCLSCRIGHRYLSQPLQ
jgi:hypothetical protein